MPPRRGRPPLRPYRARGSHQRRSHVCRRVGSSLPPSSITDAKPLLTGSLHEAAHRWRHPSSASYLKPVEHPHREACEDESRENEPEHSQVGVRLRPTHSPRVVRRSRVAFVRRVARFTSNGTRRAAATWTTSSSDG